VLDNLGYQITFAIIILLDPISLRNSFLYIIATLVYNAQLIPIIECRCTHEIELQSNSILVQFKETISIHEIIECYRRAANGITRGRRMICFFDCEEDFGEENDILRNLTSRRLYPNRRRAIVDDLVTIRSRLYLNQAPLSIAGS
jgi:hypothetical protein